MKKTRYIILLLLSFILFAFTAEAQFTKLLDFNQTNGARPKGALISDGTFLYGMTWNGGQDSLGTIFKIKSDGSGFVDLFDFNGSNGANPNHSLILCDSFLYGVTKYGGTNNMGTIFKIKPDGSGFTNLFSFNDTDGKYPESPLIYNGTFFYGTTSSGGINNNGVIFKLKPDGTGFVDLFKFNDSTSGSTPFGTLISDGNYLYGTTYGGPNNNCGSIFKIKQDGSNFTQILIFNGTNSCSPYTGLVSDGTFLYGTTMGNGYPNNEGTIFKIKPDGTGFSTLFTFILTSDSNGISAPYGEEIDGALIIDSTYLYGMTYMGGANNKGIVFKIKKNGTNFTIMFNFNYSTGANPVGSLLSDGTYLYGMTLAYGANNMGTIFKLGLSANGIGKYNNNNENISIYPNPTNGIFTIETNLNNAMLSVYNDLGKLIYVKQMRTHKTSINLSHQSAGIYLLQVKTKKGISSKRLVIEK